MKTILLAAIAATGLTAPAFAQEVTIRVHHFLSADAPGHQALKDREEAKARLDELELEWLELEEKRDQA